MVIWTGTAPHSFDGYRAVGQDFSRFGGLSAKFVGFRNLFIEILDFRRHTPYQREIRHGTENDEVQEYGDGSKPSS